MLHGAPALRAADHAKVRLVTAQVREKDDTSLIRVCGWPEDMAREWHRWLEGGSIRGYISPIERLECRRSRGRDRIEDSEQCVAMPTVVAKNETVVMEVVSRVHPHAGGQPGP